MGYVEEQYDLYKEDPSLVDPSLKTMFDTHGAPEWMGHGGSSEVAEGLSAADVKKVTSAMRYLDAIRRYGHLRSEERRVGKEWMYRKRKWCENKDMCGRQ